MRKLFLLLFVSFIFLQAHATDIFLDKMNNQFVTDTVPKEDSLKQFTGKFKFPDGSPVTEIDLVVENGKLMGSSPMGSSEFRLIKGDEFEIVAYAGTAIFKRNAEGKVTRVQVLVGDLDIEGTKVE